MSKHIVTPLKNVTPNDQNALYIVKTNLANINIAALSELDRLAFQAIRDVFPVIEKALEKRGAR